MSRRFASFHTVYTYITQSYPEDPHVTFMESRLVAHPVWDTKRHQIHGV